MYRKVWGYSRHSKGDRRIGYANAAKNYMLSTIEAMPSTLTDEQA